jgi:hypothetical protein
MKKQIFTLNSIIQSMLLLVILTTTGCYKDNEETLYGNDCNTDNVSFSATITPLINNNCVSCHSGGSPSGDISLSNYSEISAVANSGKLMGAISHEAGFSAMPQGSSKLSDCSISQVEAWIAQGLLNN